MSLLDAVSKVVITIGKAKLYLLTELITMIPFYGTVTSTWRIAIIHMGLVNAASTLRPTEG